MALFQMKRWELWLLAGLLLVLTYQGATLVSSGVDAIVNKIAYAIALAEGFFQAGSRPQRNHNPGDLTRDLTGKGIGMDGLYVIYATDNDGWQVLRKQVLEMLDGSSRIYNPDMTILEVAQHYTTTEQQSWAQNVAAALGVTIDTTLAEIT